MEIGPKAWWLKVVGRRPIANTAIMGAAVQVVRPAIALVTVPALLGHLGAAGLGVWMMALSTMGVMGFLNAGVAGATITAVGRASGEDRRETVNIVATSAMVLALLAGLATAVPGAAAAALLDWQKLLRLNGAVSGDELKKLMFVLAVSLGVGFPANVPKFILLGHLKGYLAHSLDLVGALASAGLLILGIWLGWPIYLLAAAFLFPQTAVLLFGGGVLLTRERIAFISPDKFNRATFSDLLRHGSKLALYQASFAFSSHLGLILVGLIAGPKASATFGVAQRLFALPLTFVATLNYALWPALAKADAAGHLDWARRTYLKTLSITLGVGVVVAVVMTVFYEQIIILWLGRPIETPAALTVGMAAWLLVSIAVNSSDTLLRSRGQTNLLMIAMVAMLLVALPTSILLIQQIGAAGAIWGTVIAFVLCLIIPYSIAIRRAFARPARGPAGGAAAGEPVADL